jgi:hypothetical protein
VVNTCKLTSFSRALVLERLDAGCLFDHGGTSKVEVAAWMVQGSLGGHAWTPSVDKQQGCSHEYEIEYT